jgi:hypothetical protein
MQTQEDSPVLPISSALTCNKPRPYIEHGRQTSHVITDLNYSESRPCDICGNLLLPTFSETSTDNDPEYVTSQSFQEILQTHRSMCSSTLATAVVMRCFRSFTLTGSGGTKTLSSIYPHKKNSQGVRYGLLRGQRVSAMFWSIERCLERIGLSYWYLSCDKRLTHRTFIT